MEIDLYVWIGKKCYRLMKDFGCEYMLYYLKDREMLNEYWWRPLDYWRKKGVIEGEEEKED